MTGSIELDASGEHLIISFPYREDLVEEVRSLPGRRWDRGRKVWRVPTSQVELVYQTFTKHFFQFAPEVSGLLAGTLAPAKKPQGRLRLVEDQAPAAAGVEALSVSALNQRVKEALQGQFAQPLWVVGELSNYDKARKGSHLFFSLVEKQEGDSRHRATVDAVIYENTARRLLAKLGKGDDALTLQDGIEVRALVRVDLYVPGGCYQVIVEDIDPEFTLGKMALDRERILEELRTLGLHRANADLPLPVPALRIGLLTSPDADGCSDFLRQLEESGIGFQVSLYPTRVQGPQLKPTMLAGLAWFAENAADVDVVCIVRGGGSRTDLAWFDDLEIAMAVARHPLKVLCGIGHQRDQSVLDMISHSEKTPTALGGFLVQQVTAARTRLAEHVGRLRDGVREALSTERSRLAGTAHDLRRLTQGRLLQESGTLSGQTRALRTSSLRLLLDARIARRQASRDLATRAALRLERAGGTLDRQRTALRNAAERTLERGQSRLTGQADRLRLLDPRRVVARGYALVRSEGGGILADAARVRTGNVLHIRMRDGTVSARAEGIELDQ